MLIYIYIYIYIYIFFINLFIKQFIITIPLKDTIKAFRDFKSKQKIVCSNDFLYVKVFIFKSINTIHNVMKHKC